MLKIGDKVKFLNDVGGGVITGFEGKTIAVVENEDGFEIPALISQLVKIGETADYEHVSPEKPRVKKSEKMPKAPEKRYAPEIIEGNDEARFYLAFYPTNPKNPVGGPIEMYLVNDSNFSLLYHFCQQRDSRYQTLGRGELEPNTKVQLGELAQTDLSDLPVYWMRILAFRNETQALLAPLVKSIRVPGKKFYRETTFQANDFFTGKALLFELTARPEMTGELESLDPVGLQKVLDTKDVENRPEPAAPKKKKSPVVVEVDLHIQELVDNWNGLSNREILDVQMERFHSEMKRAIELRAHRIVLIHGVGNGVLKQEIHRSLQSTYAKYPFQDASFQEYGFGATLVILRRK